METKCFLHFAVYIDPVLARMDVRIQNVPFIRYTLSQVCPVLVLSGEEYARHGAHTVLSHYTFNWPGGGQVCLCLAFLMMNTHVA